jgi:UDP-N-acetyl-2-amino-2-deoxyglucuronate dehydrogenase
MSLLRFGIIGVGNITPIHAAAIEGTPDAQFVAVATRNESRGRAFAAQHNATWYPDYRELLRRADIDVVTICTPHDLHASITIDAAAAGKHVLCEKPMARHVAECDAMIAACERAGVMLGIIFQFRFDPLAQTLKRALDAERLGHLHWVSANTIWYRSDEYYQSAPWRGSLESGGGVLINQAIHTIDLMLWLTGTPTRVVARTRTLDHAIQVEDGALALLEYPDARLGLIQATTAAFPGYPERLEFYGSRGSAVYHKGQGRLEWHLAEPREDRVDESEVSSGAARPMDISATAHIAQFQDFTAAVRAHRAPRVDGREGRRAVELIEAIYRSARADAPVALPL